MCIREEAYYNMYIQNRERWFNVNTIHLIVSFIYHTHHNKRIQIVDSHTCADVLEIHEETESLISVMWKESHYGVCEFVLKGRKLNVYDGLYHPVSYWQTVTRPLEDKINVALSKRKGYMPKDSKSGKKKGSKKFDSQLRKKKWNIGIHQTDIVNCGPIAVMVMWGLIIEDDENKLDAFKVIFKKHVTGFRDVIVKKIKNMFQTYDKYWYVSKGYEVMREKDICGFGEINISEEEHLEKKLLSSYNKKVEMETETLCRQCGITLSRIGTVTVNPCLHEFCDFCWENRKEKEFCIFCTKGIVSISKRKQSDARRAGLSLNASGLVESIESKMINFVKEEKSAALAIKASALAESIESKMVNFVKEEKSKKPTIQKEKKVKLPIICNSKVSCNDLTVSAEFLEQYMHNRILTNKKHNRIRQQCQNRQSEVMKERYSLLVPSARVGDYVSIAVPKQDRVPGTNYNVIAVIYKIRFKSKTIVAVTDLGIICKKGRAGEENYNSFSPGEFITLHQEIHYPQLTNIRTMCINGNKQGIEGLGKITLRTTYRMKFDYRDKSLMDTKEVKEAMKRKKRCACKDGKCTSRCGCKKSGIKCNKNCSCQGKCKR